MSATGLLANHIISKILLDHFEFKRVDESSIKFLPSYSDRNIYFIGERHAGGGDEYVLRAFNPLYSSFDSIKSIITVMKYLRLQGIPVPSLIGSKDGHDTIQLNRSELGFEQETTPGSMQSYPLSILSYIHGQTLNHIEKKYLTPSLLHEVGVYLGTIDKELLVRSNSSSLALMQLLWLMQLLCYAVLPIG